MSESEALRSRFEAAMMVNYGTPPLALARGAGSRVWDADGNRYLDLIAGIAVSALGHAHPAIIGAVTSQVGKLAHTSNLFVHEPGVELAERLLTLLHADAHGGARVFFCNSGTEANEAALKLVRRQQGAGRPVIVAADHSFHGRTMGALAITGKESIRAPFAPFGFDVRWVEYGDAAALAQAVDEQTAAVVLEPTQGEGGVIPAPAGYLAAARAACDRAGALLVLDEIQSGIGRTGAWFAHQAEGVAPDVLTLAKGLGGGLPIGACIGFGDSATALQAGDHGSTFGGNPIACAAALAVLLAIETADLLKNVKLVGQTLADGIEAIDHPLLAGVRGSGLWLAAVLTQDKAADVTTAARQAGFLVNAVQPDAVRLAPPLVLTQTEAEEFTAALPAILTRAQGER
jgi:acetylornithine/N-succinyldiaminopimelate aminotransferase